MDAMLPKVFSCQNSNLKFHQCVDTLTDLNGGSLYKMLDQIFEVCCFSSKKVTMVANKNIFFACNWNVFLELRHVSLLRYDNFDLLILAFKNPVCWTPKFNLASKILSTRYEESVVDKFKSNLLLMIFWLHIINYNS